MRYTEKIDFQAHCLPASYREFLKKHCGSNPDGFPTPDWDGDIQKETMETLGIGFALLSLSSPGVCEAGAEAVPLARACNEEMAALVQTDPGHLGFVGTLPLPDVTTACEEAERCLDELGADGIGLLTNHCGLYLGDRRLDPLMEELNRRNALVIVHPTAPGVMVPEVNEELPVPAFEYLVETTRAFTNMVLSDIFFRYPDIRFVFPHAGAFLPVLSDRFESFACLLRFDDPGRKLDFKAAMRHVYFDVAGFSEPKQLEMLLRDADPSHLVYGSDAPYTAIEACIGQAMALEETGKLSEEQKQGLFSENARILLPRLQGGAVAEQEKETVPVTAKEDCEQGDLQAKIRLKSPMGWVKVLVSILMDADKVHFHGVVSLLGAKSTFSDGVTDGRHYAFPIKVKLPFGQLQVEIAADRSPDGSIRGTATSPHRKPMPLVGNLI